MPDAAERPEPDFAVQLRKDLPAADTRHVLSVFSADLARLNAAITEAAQLHQSLALRRAAHALAGAAGAVGATRLDAACREAMAARSDDPAILLTQARAIDTACAYAALALTRVLAELTAG